LLETRARVPECDLRPSDERHWIIAPTDQLIPELFYQEVAAGVGDDSGMRRCRTMRPGPGCCGSILHLAPAAMMQDRASRRGRRHASSGHRDRHANTTACSVKTAPAAAYYTLTAVSCRASWHNSPHSLQQSVDSAPSLGVYYFCR